MFVSFDSRFFNFLHTDWIFQKFAIRQFVNLVIQWVTCDSVSDLRFSEWPVIQLHFKFLFVTISWFDLIRYRYTVTIKLSIIY